MPNYTFQTPSGELLSKRLTFVEYQAVKDGELKLVDDQDNELKLVFNPGDVGFVLKDGESGGWASKALKENRYRTERRHLMTRRERDNVMKPKLVPNFKGQEAHSWADVRDHAMTVNGAASASTYDRLVRLEKK